VDWREKGTKIEVVGREPVDGAETYDLKLTSARGKVLHMYVDAKSGLPVRQTTVQNVQGNTVPMEMRIGDYRDVDGLKLPHLLVTRIQGTPMEKSVRIDKIELNPALDPARFGCRPRPLPRSREARGAGAFRRAVRIGWSRSSRLRPTCVAPSRSSLHRTRHSSCFSPLGERLWVPDWEPEILHPPGESWAQGLIFRTREEKGDAVWLVTALDRAGHESTTSASRRAVRGARARALPARDLGGHGRDRSLHVRRAVRRRQSGDRGDDSRRLRGEDAALGEMDPRAPGRDLRRGSVTRGRSWP